jgi:zinc transport system substrate-binding protein
LLLFGFVGCGSQQASNADRNENQPQEERLSVYASFYPMYDFAVKIGGDKADVTNLVPAGAEPHDWEPAAADVAGLEEADVFIYNGAGMEHWAADILESLQNETLIAAEASRGITLMEGHHDHEEDEGEEEPEEEEGYDPHVWLSPMNAKAEMRNITDAFAQADPDSRDYYETNYATYAAELDALDQAFRETLAPLPNKDIIVAHQAFGYLCADYGLNQVPIEGLSPDSEPDPVRMAEIIDFAEEHHVKVIFFETLASPKVAETIANAIGAETDVLSPIEGLSDEEQAAGDDYFSVMRRNLESLKAALQ